MFKQKKLSGLIALGALGALLTGCGGSSDNTAPAAAPVAKNVIFFLGDGMGMTTQTAARIYSVGEDGELTMDTLPETAFIRTYSNDAQVTDSAPSMAAYMTGVKMNNEVISMSADTIAKNPNADGTNNCGSGNGSRVGTLLESAKAKGLATGVITTTRITHATPAATYAHTCHRDAESDIAAQLVPGGAGFNSALGSGVDVIMGGGSNFFLPTASGGKRADGRNLTTEMTTAGYSYVTSGTALNAVNTSTTNRLFGLFTKSHMDYDLDRSKLALDQPSLATMTTKALDVLTKNSKGLFLMVEGGRIDHALHDTTAKKALQDTVAFDDAIKAAITKMNSVDPGLKNTLIVVTADHDHTLVLNGYAARTGKTTPANAGILGVLRNYYDGLVAKDADGSPFTIIGFGNGENRVMGNRTALSTLDDTATSADTYHQEAAIHTPAGSETHGGTDVFLGATGAGAESFHGVMDNTAVYTLIHDASGL